MVVESINKSGAQYVIIKYLKKLCLITLIYLLAICGFSIAWLYLGAVLLFINKYKSKSERPKWKIAKIMALGQEKEFLRENLSYLPSWVNFPDFERVEWLNRIIRQTWVKVNHYVRDLVFRKIEHTIQKHIPGFHFKEVVLGQVPLRIDGIKVYEEQEIARSKILMDLDFSYAGDCSIQFLVARLPGGIENFQIRGRLRVVMEPLVSSLPIIGGLKVFMIEEPEITFELSGVTQIFGNTPGFKNIIQNSVLANINKILLFPNVYKIKLAKGDSIGEVNSMAPEGILRVHVVEALDLLAKDINLVGRGKSDPYVEMTVGTKRWLSETIKDKLDPKWNEWVEFESEVNAELEIKVWDYDEGFKDDFLGSAVIPIANIAKTGHDNLWIPLEGVKKGKIHVRLFWLTLSSDYSDLENALKEVQLLNPYLHSAILFIYIDGAKNLPLSSSSTSPDSFVRLQLESQEAETEVVKRNQNPIWEQAFTFLVTNPKTAILNVEVFDKKNKNVIGEVDIFNIAELGEHVNMILKQTFALLKTGTESTLTCSLELRILKSEHAALEEIEKNATPLEINESNSSSNSKKSLDKSLSEQSPRSSVSSILSANKEGSARIKLTLRYSKQRQKLIVVVHQVEDVLLKNPADLPDLYVKLYLLSGRNKDKKRRTRVVKNKSNPIFDETFEYHLSADELNFKQLEIALVEEKTMRNRIIGQVIIVLNKYEDLAQPLNAWFDLKPKQ